MSSNAIPSRTHMILACPPRVEELFGLFGACCPVRLACPGNLVGNLEHVAGQPRAAQVAQAAQSTWATLQTQTHDYSIGSCLFTGADTVLDHIVTTLSLVPVV